jgi:hypothetical protein
MKKLFTIAVIFCSFMSFGLAQKNIDPNTNIQIVPFLYDFHFNVQSIPQPLQTNHTSGSIIIHSTTNSFRDRVIPFTGCQSYTVQIPCYSTNSQNITVSLELTTQGGSGMVQHYYWWTGSAVVYWTIKPSQLARYSIRETDFYNLEYHDLIDPVNQSHLEK